VTHVAFIGLTALILNSACLVAFPAASVWYFSNVALHPVLGVVVVGAFAWLTRRGYWTTSVFFRVGLVILVLGLICGVGIAVAGTTTLTRALVYIYLGTTVAGALLLAIHLWRNAQKNPTGVSTASVRVSLAVAVVCLIFAPAARVWHDATWRANHRVENPTQVPLTMTEEANGPNNPFFPSSATTTTGDVIPSDFFLTSETCGRCHRDIYDQWNASVHHFSSFNNQWYRKSIEYMQDVVGTEPSKWCAGCHDHAVFFNGQFDRPIRDQIDTPEAQAGLGCTSCHSIVHVGSTMGQGDFVIEYPPLHDLATSDNPVLSWAHDQLVAVAPEPHRRTFLKPFHREQSEAFCSTCHKVHLDTPVNDYRWVRGFNAYDNWQASGVSGEGARSFYYPPQAQTCNDCHMPRVASDDPAAKDGYVRSHRFAAANTALPFVNGDTEQLEAVQDFLKAGQVSVDIFGISRAPETASPTAQPLAADNIPTIASTFGVGEESPQLGIRGATTTGPVAEVFAPLDVTPVAVRRGESIRVEVVVRTRNVGHFFPGGTVDAFDVWVELEAFDNQGRVLLHSGSVANEGEGPVDPAAHFYRSRQLDAHGNVINKRNAWMTRSVAYVRLIPPGAADTIHYRLHVPDDAGDQIFLRAKVNHRKFDWWYTQWAYAGVRDPNDNSEPPTAAYDDGQWVFTGDTSLVSGDLKSIPNLPITVMAETEASLTVIDEDDTIPGPPNVSIPSSNIRERWNDYGIGLLLQGDLRGAAEAFRRVITIDPDYADGPVNLARVLLQEGDVDNAIPHLETALTLVPDLARAHFFLGSALRTLGRYDEALTHFQVARTQYPRDRVVLGEIGRVHFLERRFEEAIRTFQDVLRIDPEDLLAHYNLMLAYRGNGDTEQSAREQILYERFKADEPSQAITGPYLLEASEDNNERQPVHEH
jgi:tetratricopeptide (TPR) repeat protein